MIESRRGRPSTMKHNVRWSSTPAIASWVHIMGFADDIVIESEYSNSVGASTDRSILDGRSRKIVENMKVFVGDWIPRSDI